MQNSSNFPTVVLIGAGGLGVPAAWGIVNGTSLISELELKIVDFDTVALENLHRQVLFQSEDIGHNKAERLASTLEQKLSLASLSTPLSNTPQLDTPLPNTSLPNTSQSIKEPQTKCCQIKISSLSAQLDEENIAELLADAAVVIDATDSVQSKLLVNDYCVKNNISFCYGGSVGTMGQLLAYDARSPGGCLRCLFGDLNADDLDCLGPTCQQAGILGAAVGAIGFALAGESLRLLSSERQAKYSLHSRYLRYELTTNRWTESSIPKTPGCKLCAAVPSPLVLNIRSESCPRTFLLTKLAAETLAADQSLYAQLGSETIAHSVRQSSLEEGYRVSQPWQEELNSWVLLLQKRGSDGV